MKGKFSYLRQRKAPKPTGISFEYRDGKLYFAKRTVSLNYLRVTSYLIRFLSLSLIISALLRVLLTQDLGGILFAVPGGVFYWVGSLYDRVVREAAAREKS